MADVDVSSKKSDIRSSLFWTTILSVLLSPLVIVGPFIAGYSGGRKARSAPAALIAALGPALIWVGVWWWLSSAGVPIGKERIHPPVDLFAPTTGLAILGGAFAGSGGRVSHIIGAAILLCSLGWFGSGAKPFYELYKKATERPASGPEPVVTATNGCPDRLKKLYDAAKLYAESWDDTLPPAETWMTALRNPDQPFAEDEFLHCSEVKGGTTDYGYAMNSALGGKKLSSIEPKATTPLFFDSDSVQQNASAASPSTSRHGGKSNVVFADGHVGQQ
jgi:prepilin-type processing-associated H-X9-DG protein